MLCKYKIETLARDLIMVPSINNTKGEAEIALRIAEFLKGIEYFQKNPQNLVVKDLSGDRLGRKNVFALVEGRGGCSSKTVILHGHVDTVGVEDYGNLKAHAFNPEMLEASLKKMDVSVELKEDLYSGDWMFGRGSADMKSGLAVHMSVVEYYTQKVEQLRGNILFIATPVEENQHTGIMEALTVLQELKDNKGLDYRVALNSDYISEMYPGDRSRYIYLGTVGKILPCFYIIGKETHAGQSFEGFNPNLLAAELVRKIESNTDLCDGYKSEYTQPPLSLKLTDLKPSYDVQTALSAFVYFNFFVHRFSVKKILSMLEIIAEEAFNETIAYLNDQYKKYCSLTGQKYSGLPWKGKVYTYEELHKLAVNKPEKDLEGQLKLLINDQLEKNQDPRIICRLIVEKLVGILNIKGPALVLFIAPPYNPNNTQKEDVFEEKIVIEKVMEIIDEMTAACGEEFVLKHYFPYTSDSSYLKIDDDEQSINKLINNFPGWDAVYPAPVGTAKRLNVPALNFGVYGKDAHKWTERVYKPYTFSVLPELTVKAIDRFLQ